MTIDDDAVKLAGQYSEYIVDGRDNMKGLVVTIAVSWFVVAILFLTFAYKTVRALNDNSILAHKIKQSEAPHKLSIADLDDKVKITSNFLLSPWSPDGDYVSPPSWTHNNKETYITAIEVCNQVTQSYQQAQDKYKQNV